MLIALASALVILSPPAKYDKGIPYDYAVQLQSFGMITFACTNAKVELSPRGPRDVLMGCINTGTRLIILPKEDADFPYDHACWLMNARHEGAHAWGWGTAWARPGDPSNRLYHPGGHTYVCNPKR